MIFKPNPGKNILWSYQSKYMLKFQGSASVNLTSHKGFLIFPMFSFQLQIKKIVTACLALILVLPVIVNAREVINLYQGPIPNSKATTLKKANHSSSPGVFNVVTNPTLEIYLPKKKTATGAAVVSRG